MLMVFFTCRDLILVIWRVALFSRMGKEFRDKIV